MRDADDEGPGRPPGGRPPQPWRRPEFAGPPTRPGAPAPALEEGEELVAGRRPVEEAFAAARPALRLLVTPQRRQALEKIVLHATTLRIPIVEVEGGSLTALAGFDGHQGVAVVVEARRFASVEDVLARSIERGEPAFVLVLDSLEDPQNVGTLLRSAEAVGVHGVVFPTERQAPLSPAAVKASAGATEHLLLTPVDDLPATLTDLRLRGVRIVGSDGEASLAAREADLRGPIALVVGSEGHGLSPTVRRRCDLFVRLPMRGAIDSLNAAVAGSVLLFEVLGQRDAAGGAPKAGGDPAAGGAPATAKADAKPAPPKPRVTRKAAVQAEVDGEPAPAPADAAPDRVEAAAQAAPQADPEAPAAETEPGTNVVPKGRSRRKAAAPPASPVPDGPADEAPPPRPKKRSAASFGRFPATAEQPAVPDAPAEDGPELLPDAPAEDGPELLPDAPAQDGPELLPDAPAQDGPELLPE
jgi:23S rRNA (guanosine2251-2'-O)-methyltransferase